MSNISAWGVIQYAGRTAYDFCASPTGQQVIAALAIGSVIGVIAGKILSIPAKQTTIETNYKKVSTGFASGVFSIATSSFLREESLLEKQERKAMFKAKKDWLSEGFSQKFVDSLDRSILFCTVHHRYRSIPKYIKQLTEKHLIEGENTNPTLLRNIVVELYWNHDMDLVEKALQPADQPSDSLVKTLKYPYLRNLLSTSSIEFQYECGHLLLHFLIGDPENTEGLIRSGILTEKSLKKLYENHFKNKSCFRSLPSLDLVEKFASVKRGVCKECRYLTNETHEREDSDLLSEAYYYHFHKAGLSSFGSVERVGALLEDGKIEAAEWLFMNLSSWNWYDPQEGVWRWLDASEEIRAALSDDLYEWMTKHDNVRRECKYQNPCWSHIPPIHWDHLFKTKPGMRFGEGFQSEDEHAKTNRLKLQYYLDKLPKSSLDLLGIAEKEVVISAKQLLCKILNLDVNADEVTLKKAAKKYSIQLHPDKNPNSLPHEEAFKFFSACYTCVFDPSTQV